MNPSDDVLEPDVQNALAQLKTFPPRHPHAAARGRAQFLAQAHHLQQAVSARSFWRQIEWINPFSRKERFSMPVLVAVVLAFTVAMGGSGVAVYAAQDALPTDPLYGVKLVTEEMQLYLAGDSTARVNTLLDLTQRRAQEIAALSAQGKPVPEQVTNRLEAQTEAALQIAAGMDDATMTRVLEQMRNRFTEQVQVVAQVQAHAPEQATPALQRVQETLTTRLQVVETALTDPLTLRERARHRFTPSPRPTDLSPRPTITRTLTIPPRPTELPPPPITRTLTIPPRPTELPPPPITRTLTIPPRPTEQPRPPITLPIPRPTELPRPSITHGAPNPGPWNPTPPANATPVAPPWGPHKP
ncbi:MAG: DUF5667 domain-containing protein [Anaerolineae bacterium]|nr:DUF5667 domain-containing protein [Anaerolineae bacterium]